MTYLLSNIFTKNYWNRTTIVEVIVGGWVVSFFETQCSNCSLFVVLTEWVCGVMRVHVFFQNLSLVSRCQVTMPLQQ